MDLLQSMTTPEDLRPGVTMPFRGFAVMGDKLLYSTPTQAC